MKQAALILVFIIMIALSTYVGISIYRNYVISTIPTSFQDALQIINNPDFTLDPFNSNAETPSIKTSVQDDLENIDPAIIDSLMNQYTASSYDNFIDFYQGN